MWTFLLTFAQGPTRTGARDGCDESLAFGTVQQVLVNQSSLFMNVCRVLVQQT